MTRLPTLFLPHGGGPCFFMDWTPPDEWDDMAAYLRKFPSEIVGEPKAIIVISGHWEEEVITIQKNAAPPLLFDYYNFPPHTYELTFPAPGSPELSDRIATLLDAAGIENRFETERGFDHGVFIPLKVAYPDPKLPIVQVSLRNDLDPGAHIALGRALAPLRDEGVLILGSGLSFHNMEMMMPRLRSADPDNAPIDASRVFDDWLIETLTILPADAREAALVNWAKAPAALEAHPREEHLLPLHVVAGAAMGDPGRQSMADEVMGATMSAFSFESSQT